MESGVLLYAYEEAVIRASKFASDNESLLSDIGCNIWKLIKEMQSFDRQQKSPDHLKIDGQGIFIIPGLRV